MHIKRHGFFLLLALCGMPEMYSQTGGSSTWNFLDLTTSARVASLGGKVAALPDEDLSLVYQNPSLLSPGMSNQLIFNYINYYTDIAYGYVSYARDFSKLGTFGAGIHYIDYGNFIAADPTGIITGNFTAAEYSFNLYYSKSIDSNFTAGVCLKNIYSHLEDYHSSGLAADLGISYTSDDRLFDASLAIRNLGFQFSGYNGAREPIPFEIMAGLSQKLAHAPFRFLVTAQQLQRLDLTYVNPEDNNTVDPISGKQISKGKAEQIADMTMRHLIFGVEFTPLKSFTFRFGYNHKLRKEMALSLKPAMVGFSWGFGLNLSRFRFSYGRAAYHLAGATNLFSVSTNLADFRHKKNAAVN